MGLGLCEVLHMNLKISVFTCKNSFLNFSKFLQMSLLLLECLFAFSTIMCYCWLLSFCACVFDGM